jgi:hypothetical protein
VEITYQAYEQLWIINQIEPPDVIAEMGNSCFSLKLLSCYSTQGAAAPLHIDPGLIS